MLPSGSTNGERRALLFPKKLQFSDLGFVAMIRPEGLLSGLGAFSLLRGGI